MKKHSNAALLLFNLWKDLFKMLKMYHYFLPITVFQFILFTHICHFFLSICNICLFFWYWKLSDIKRKFPCTLKKDDYENAIANWTHIWLTKALNSTFKRKIFAWHKPSIFPHNQHELTRNFWNCFSNECCIP